MPPGKGKTPGLMGDKNIGKGWQGTRWHTHTAMSSGTSSDIVTPKHSVLPESGKSTVECK